MSGNNKSGLLAPESQPDLFGTEPAPAYRPDLGKVRARLQKILGEATAAQTVPWDAGRFSLYRTIFPQMTLWLPEDEAARFRLEFEAELTRLQAAEGGSRAGEG